MTGCNQFFRKEPPFQKPAGESSAKFGFISPVKVGISWNHGSVGKVLAIQFSSSMQNQVPLNIYSSSTAGAETGLLDSQSSHGGLRVSTCLVVVVVV